MHLLKSELEKPVEHLVHCLATDLFCQSGRVGHVAEQHSHELAFAL
jgi:hypothetical protein